MKADYPIFMDKADWCILMEFLDHADRLYAREQDPERKEEIRMKARSKIFKMHPDLYDGCYVKIL